MENDEQQRIQRALNDAKKRELTEKYGGDFHSVGPDLPPEIEAAWLRSIEEFEQQFASAKTTTIRLFLNNPSFTPLRSVPQEELGDRIDEVTGLLADHGIIVHFHHPVPEDEVYAFLTEELLDHEIDDIHIEGMTQNYIYEEFHPDDRMDAALTAEMFLYWMSHDDRECFLRELAPDGTPGNDGTVASRERLLSLASAFTGSLTVCLHSHVDVDVSTVTGTFGRVRARMDWEGLERDTLRPVSGNDAWVIDLWKSEESMWQVVSAAKQLRED